MVKPPLLFVDCWKLREMLTKMGEEAREYVRRNFFDHPPFGGLLSPDEFYGAPEIQKCKSRIARATLKNHPQRARA